MTTYELPYVRMVINGAKINTEAMPKTQAKAMVIYS